MKNVAGKLKIKRTYEEGSILDVIPQVQQVKQRDIAVVFCVCIYHCGYRALLVLMLHL